MAIEGALLALAVLHIPGFKPVELLATPLLLQLTGMGKYQTV
jgi:hypothetical protein